MTGRRMLAAKCSHAHPSRVTAPSHKAAGCDVTNLVVVRAVSRHQKAEAEGSRPLRQWLSTCGSCRSGEKERSATRLPRVYMTHMTHTMDDDVLCGSHAVPVTLSARPARSWNTQTRRGAAARPLCRHPPSGVQRRAMPALAMVSRPSG